VQPYLPKVNKSLVRLKDSGVLKVSELVELELDTLTVVDTKLKVKLRTGVSTVSSSSNMEVAGTVVTLNGSSSGSGRWMNDVHSIDLLGCR